MKLPIVALLLFCSFLNCAGGGYHGDYGRKVYHETSLQIYLQDQDVSPWDESQLVELEKETPVLPFPVLEKKELCSYLALLRVIRFAEGGHRVRLPLLYEQDLDYLCSHLVHVTRESESQAKRIFVVYQANPLSQTLSSTQRVVFSLWAANNGLNIFLFESQFLFVDDDPQNHFEKSSKVKIFDPTKKEGLSAIFASSKDYDIKITSGYNNWAIMPSFLEEIPEKTLKEPASEEKKVLLSPLTEEKSTEKPASAASETDIKDPSTPKTSAAAENDAKAPAIKPASATSKNDAKAPATPKASTAASKASKASKDPAIKEEVKQSGTSVPELLQSR